MDIDDVADVAPIRRSSRQMLELHQAVEDFQLEDEDSDEAAPPPIRRKRPASVGATPSSTFSKPTAPPLPSKNPLRLTPEPLSPHRRPKNFSHPFKDQLRRNNPIPYRNPSKPILSYRSNPRLPPSLRRWSSLETIESVATTPSVETPRDEPQYPVAERSLRRFLIFDEDDDASAKYSAQSEPSLTNSSESSSTRSAPTPTQPSGSRKHSASSVLRKLKPSKTHEPLLMPEHLEIEKRVSIDQQSQRTNSSGSVMTISSGRPSEIGYLTSSGESTSQKSHSSKDWKSSNFDISNLSEADLKKCKKNGINPALYAEMKAARKGKFVSPIGGNTFL